MPTSFSSFPCSSTSFRIAASSAATSLPPPPPPEPMGFPFIYKCIEYSVEVACVQIVQKSIWLEYCCTLTEGVTNLTPLGATICRAPEGSLQKTTKYGHFSSTVLPFIYNTVIKTNKIPEIFDLLFLSQSHDALISRDSDTTKFARVNGRRDIFKESRFHCSSVGISVLP